MKADSDYFSCIRRAKIAYQNLLAKYPEFKLLSARELEVLEQLLTDKTQTEIAHAMFITDSSVHFHCKNIYKKLEVSGRRQILIKYCDLLENGG